MGIFSAIAGLFGFHPEEDALNAAKSTIEKGYDSASAQYAPYQTVGKNALTQYLDATGQGDSAKGLSDFQSSPIYQLLQKSLGLGDAGVLANSAGSLNSGNTIRAVQDYNRNQADKSFGQYLSPIASTATTGYDATGKIADLGIQKAGSVGNIQNQIGQVQGANSIWSGLDSGLSSIAGIAGGLSGVPGLSGLGGAAGGNPLTSLFSRLGIGGGGGGGRSSFSSFY
jgi:hypothetical protein